MSGPAKKNTITGFHLEQLREREEMCARLQDEYDKILAFLDEARSKGTNLDQLAQMSSSARSSKKKRRPTQPSSSTATSSHQIDSVTKDIEDLEIRRDAAKHSLDRAQQERLELLEMLG